MAPMNSLMLLFLTAERSLAPTGLLGLLTSTPAASDEVVVELACGGRHRLGILLEVLFLGKEGENVLTCTRAWHKYWAVLKVGWTCMVSERRAEMASDDLCEKWEEDWAVGWVRLHRPSEVSPRQIGVGALEGNGGGTRPPSTRYQVRPLKSFLLTVWCESINGVGSERGGEGYEKGICISNQEAEEIAQHLLAAPEMLYMKNTLPHRCSTQLSLVSLAYFWTKALHQSSFFSMATAEVQAATNALPEEPVETQPTEKKEAAANEEVVEVETTKVDAVTEKVDNPVVEVDEPETEPVSEIAAEEMAQEAMPELPKTDVPSETDITGDAPVAPGEEDTKEVAVEVEPKAEEKEEELAQEEIPEPLPADVRLETVVTGEAPEAPAVEFKEEVNVREVEDEAAAA
ncbi:hypothetical protein B296_00004628 [Ensete ventricosum]|uniref:WPP domain-containing protein n=1 Tax=Ensete ventricosum TaxID=4639 RepID=A0A427AK79_ENSVE|nr:hypothetical protein B296_00004628 [Ensete ventricosum]